jgi:hypothetical protein
LGASASSIDSRMVTNAQHRFKNSFPKIRLLRLSDPSSVLQQYLPQAAVSRRSKVRTSNSYFTQSIETPRRRGRASVTKAGTAPSRDLLGYPLEDTAGVAFEYPVAGSAPEALDCGHERRWLAAIVAARRRFHVRCALRRISHSNSLPRRGNLFPCGEFQSGAGVSPIVC